MPTSAERRRGWAVDTSVAVPYLDESHGGHEAAVGAVRERRPALAGHAAFETFSVLTRLPGQLQVPGPVATAALSAAFPDPCWLTAEEHADLLGRLGPAGITGGAVYDALVGETARCRARVLLTRDRRAARTYDVVGARYELVS